MSNILSEFDKYASRIDHGQKLQERAFFFQNKGENLFGIFYLPLEGIFEKHKTGIVMCQPFAMESMVMQRVEVDIARNLAKNRFPVFRFHYRGCGESEGVSRDVTFSSQISDTLCAIKYFMDQIDGIDSILLLGLRMGGSVAIKVSELEPLVKYLILCEPVVKLKNYFYELLRSKKIFLLSKGEKSVSIEQLHSELINNGKLDVLGYLVHKEIFTETESIDLCESIKGFSGNSLLVELSFSNVKISFQSLREQLMKTGGTCDYIAMKEHIHWFFSQSPEFTSKRLIHTIVSWCKENILYPAK